MSTLPFDPTRADVGTLTAAYADGEVSPVAVTQTIIELAENAGRDLSAIAAIDQEVALAAAAASEQRWSDGQPLGPLDGVPVSVKDSFHMEGLKRWHGSKLNDASPPSKHDGAPVKRLREGGAVVFAKTAMPDFGLLGSGVSSQFGVTRNPWDPATSPGGSSSGAAALVAIGGGPVAIGTDMGGSVRFPAALTGLVGLKPTQGRIAYDPPKLIGNAGPMGRTVADVAALLSVIGKPDDSDHLSLPGQFSWDGAVPESFDGVNIGVLVASNAAPLDPEIEHAVMSQAVLLAAAGANVTEISAPVLSDDDIAVLETVLMTRGLPELIAAPEDAWTFLPKPLLATLMRCKELTAVEHVTNEKKVEAMRARAAGVLNSFDYVVQPVAPIVSFPAEDPRPSRDGEEIENLIYTIPHNLTSLPAGVVCTTMSETGAPIGVQVSGRRFDDGGVLSVLAFLERSRPFDVPYPFATR
ncbi:aspartyl-tRNA(Asn)/glutamyl-tRNA(Gln) amidotransferase subunit A [Ilumatobacter fluminis]|uniref:Aspartyl-tRNA(Asn)/glutamyl-tRNA(Gln) amidotransferase subunit A n=1 Tax=Ilumatobacter fluminis TaxID=467091 RepID=A0A4R7I0B5_9ACTN|nr:amidase family protein [Ilumatobacter fluminis]TDT15873.1 aspartyl-tRNA(Asn)/glutamyl-tRNA(Gln) amidotransferase subunit A [Ilumatobacter fluminis]